MIAQKNITFMLDGKKIDYKKGAKVTDEQHIGIISATISPDALGDTAPKTSVKKTAPKPKAKPTTKAKIRGRKKK